VYSEAQVARLRLIARALETGFRPSEVVVLEAADLQKLLDASLADVAPHATPTPPPPSLSAAASAKAAEAPPVAALPATPTVESASALDAVVDAVMRDDIKGLRALLRMAAVALGPRRFVVDLAHPLAIRVGELWQAGRLEVRQEHIASAALTAQLHLMLGALEDGERSPRVLLATLPGEHHVLGLDLISVYLVANFVVFYVFGGDFLPGEIVAVANAHRVDAVGIVVSPASDVVKTASSFVWLALWLFFWC